jgi:hypothetical protein
MRLALILALAAALGGFAPRAVADITVLLEEPYSLDGAIAGTGHTAVYLSNVCAESPIKLRRCQPGESGVVISRYHAIGSYDWLAIPLIPYLYAVDKSSDVPLIANPKLEAALRDRYRRKYLESIVPDGPSGATPSGNWYELIGSAYDRTLYGFQIETSPEKDDAFIAAYNSAPNRMSYKAVTRNCADFVREAVNFYYPHAIGRSYLADLAVSTPKHAAKSLVRYSNKHPELRLTSFIIPQVPGTIRRSTPVHGLVDSVFKAKKYELPLLALHPIIAGGVAVDYYVNGRFDPAKNARILDPAEGTLHRPLTEDERRSYEKGLAEMLQAEPELASSSDTSAWKLFQSKAGLRTDDAGAPVLEALIGENLFAIGITRANILSSSAPDELSRQLLVARIRDELKNKSTARKISDDGLREDWKLLQTIVSRERSSDLTLRDSSSAAPKVQSAADTGGAN